MKNLKSKIMKRAQIKSVKLKDQLITKLQIRLDMIGAHFINENQVMMTINDLELISKILSRVRLKNDIPFADEKALEKINFSIHSIDQEIMQI